MDTRQLAAFCAVVEKKSFSQAAEGLGASTGRGGSVVPLVLCGLQQAHPEVSVALPVSDTQRIIELVAERDVELGVVGFARRNRSMTFEPLFRDEVVLACPPKHRFA